MNNAVTFALAFGLLLACGSGERATQEPVSLVTGGSAGTQGGSRSSQLGSGGVDRAGASGGVAEQGGSPVGSAGGAGGASEAAGGSPELDAGAGGETDGPVPGPIVIPESVCAMRMRAGTPRSLGLAVTSDSRLGSVSADELSIVWTRVQAGQVTLYSAARDAVDEPFQKPTWQVIPAAPGKVALSADGLRVLFVATDGRHFEAWERRSRQDSFADTNSFEFELLNDSAESGLSPAEAYGEPVLSADDRTLFYSRFGGGRTHTVFAARRFSSGAPWSSGTELALPERFDASAESHPELTGVSSDLQTLFLWDPASARATAVFLEASPDAVYSSVALLGAFRGAAPSVDCKRLFYEDPTGKLGLVTADLL
ncbi:MAG TPA: hypothetical protein VFQ61_30835 [Polyangiaceae bacterium]|nr:hypothetical protein [Polyangiaceae bacterium]